MKEIIKYGIGGVYTEATDSFQHGVMPNISRTLKANMHDAGVAEKICVSSRGRNPNNPSDRSKGALMEQRYEPKMDGCTNSLTTVQKDNLILEHEEMEKSEYRIRKLTPLECWRLMGFSDQDYNAASLVNAKTQLYRQAGNAIVENVLVAIFGQMVPGKENIYKERGNRKCA